MREKPDATLRELVGRIKWEEKVGVSESTVSRVLRKLGLERKIKSFVAAERDESEREEFHLASSGPAGADLVFVDEMGINVNLARRYDRARSGERVARAIEGAGAVAVYLPPYSPDFNPIEECWSKIKEKLRAAAARAHVRLIQALRVALATITQKDILGWSQHAGYNFTTE